MKQVLSLLYLLCTTVTGFVICSTARGTAYGAVHRMRHHTSVGMITASFAPTKASWTVDDDTAEIEWGSSVDKVRALAKQKEEKRLRDIETLVAPMDDFRRRHDPVFRDFIARTGYSKMPSIESLTTATSSTTVTTAQSTTSSLSTMWERFVSSFQQK